ncbi:hypothetical protein QTP88_011905 [Uroleucon formosanum]
MTSRARDKFRKYKSGNKKKIKQNKEKYLKLQQGSFERFLKDDEVNKIKKVGATSSTLNVNLPEIVEQNIVESEIEIVDATSDVNLPEIVEQNIVESEIQLVNADVNLVKNINKELESFVQTNEKGPICDVNTTSYDWSEPSNWPQLLTNTDKYEIVKLGPARVENYDIPITIYENGQKRRFTANNYYRKLSNSDLIDRKWNESHLCNIGLKDWKHLSEKLKSHESSKIHFQSIKSWMELNVRISKNLTIDKEHLAIIEKEKNHWRNVLTRVISIIHYLSKNNDAFRGPSDVLFTKSNGHFLGAIEMLNKGQAYDNGSNMVGKYQGVQTRVTNQNPRAFFTPCASHNLNLVLRDAAKNSSRASTFFGTVQRIYTIFSASTSRWDIFKKCCSIFTVKQWSETRWESRVNSVKALRFQLPNIIEALEEVSETSNDSIAKSDARSLITEICTYEFILSLIIWYDILVQVNIVSKSLQGKDATINISNDMLQSLLAFLKSYRETGFMNAKIIANNLADEIEVEPAFKKTRLRKKKKTFDYEGNDERINDGEENFRQEYFLLVIDQATSSVEKRFKQIE